MPFHLNLDGWVLVAEYQVIEIFKNIMVAVNKGDPLASNRSNKSLFIER
jgi:hypothetical protein